MTHKIIKLIEIIIIIVLLMYCASGCSTQPMAYKSAPYNDVQDDTVSVSDTEYDEYDETPKMKSRNNIDYNVESSVQVESASAGDIPTSSSITIISNTNYNKGTLAFKMDSIFIIDVLSRVEAKIVKSTDSAKVSYMVQMFQHTTNGKVIKRQIPIGNIMNMELYSFDKDAFEITKISGDNQVIDDNIVASWLWSVKPLKVGQQELIIKAIIKKNDANIEQIVYDETIKVVSKPKKIYTTNIIIDDVFMTDEVNIIKYEMTECDNCVDGIFWGNNGVVKLVIDNEKEFVIESDENVFVDKKYQTYKWVIKPIKNGTVNYSIILENDNERITLHQGQIKVKTSLVNWFKKLVVDILGFWNFLIFTLLIPLYMWLKKKYGKKKEVV